LPISTNKFDGEGFACERGNLFIGTSGANVITQTGCDWWNNSTLTYNYALDPVESVFALVPANVGVGKIDPTGSVTSSAKEMDKSTKIKVYPNPAEKETHIEITLAKKETVTVTFLTVGGAKVGQVTTKTLGPGVHIIEYATAGFKPGIYLCQVETSEGSFRQKVLVK
ncbi:MAG: T9SS type A sorting domain-containing protein, partial [Rufibacter sp.]